METTYRLTPDELTVVQARYAASLDHYFGVAWIRRSYRFIIIPALVGATALLVSDVLISVGIVLGCILVNEVIQRAYHRLYRKNLYLPDNQTFQLQQWRVAVTDIGIEFDGELARTTYYWKTIQLLSHDDKFIYVFISRSQLVAIPKRAFRSSEEADSFCETIRGRMRPESEQGGGGSAHP
jgi:hypothetical protein